MQQGFGKVRTLGLTQARDETQQYIDYIKWELQSLATLHSIQSLVQPLYKLSFSRYSQGVVDSLAPSEITSFPPETLNRTHFLAF